MLDKNVTHVKYMEDSPCPQFLKYKLEKTKTKLLHSWLRNLSFSSK